MITYLICSSSPTDQGPLHLGREHKVIKHSLDSANNRDQFRVVACTATTIDDLRRYLLEYNPTLVHFCGHGAGDEGLCFENDNGETHVVDGDRLAKLFHLVNEDLKCVVLNACYSEAQAKPISEHIDFVIGMMEGIGDAAAIKFSQGFYEALWSGQSYEKAYKFGCSAIDTANIDEDHVPVILKSPRLGADRLSYTENTQEVENFILKFIRSDSEERVQLALPGDTAVLIKHTTKEVEDEIPQNWSSVTVIGIRSIGKSYKEAKATVRNGLHSHTHTFYLKSVENGFLMDWEASMGYWPIPFNTFKALGAVKPIQVRIRCELHDFFPFAFPRQNYIGLRLHHLNNGYVYGFMPIKHPDCKRLVDYLYDGDAHRVILEILPSDENTDYVLVTKFVRNSWISSDPD